MAKLPAREKVFVLFFRRANPDEVLIVERVVKRATVPGLPSIESEAGEYPRDAALRLAEDIVDGEPIGEDKIGDIATYRVKAGPRAGDWTERFHAVEVAPGSSALEGEWLPHYDAKARAGADAPRVRAAIAELRELARLKP